MIFGIRTLLVKLVPLFFLTLLPGLGYANEVKLDKKAEITSGRNYGASGFGFSGPFHGITTVRQALDTNLFGDDLPVSFVGYIKSSLGGEMYLFTDGEYEIAVEIDHEKWLGQSATPNTKVHIYGELDKSILGTKVDVDRIVVLAN